MVSVLLGCLLLLAPTGFPCSNAILQTGTLHHDWVPIYRNTPFGHPSYQHSVRQGRTRPQGERKRDETALSLDWLQDLRLYRYYTGACFLATSIEFHTLPLTVQEHEERERAKLASTLPMIVIKRPVFLSQVRLLANERAVCNSIIFPPVQIQINATNERRIK